MLSLRSMLSVALGSGWLLSLTDTCTNLSKECERSALKAWNSCVLLEHAPNRDLTLLLSHHTSKSVNFHLPAAITGFSISRWHWRAKSSSRTASHSSLNAFRSYSKWHYDEQVSPSASWSFPCVRLLSEDKGLFVQEGNHRTHMLWRRESERWQIGLGLFRGKEQGRVAGWSHPELESNFGIEELWSGLERT